MEADTSSSGKTLRRRHYDAQFKPDLVKMTLQPGASVAKVAREHGINANQLFKWRRQQWLEDRPRSADAQPASLSLIPVTLVDEAVPQPPATKRPADGGQIEIHLAVGRIVVNGAADAATLRVVLESLRP
jgi:transposase